MWAHAETLWKRYVASPKSQELILRLSILSLIYLWAFSIRLVSTVPQQLCSACAGMKTLHRLLIFGETQL